MAITPIAVAFVFVWFIVCNFVVRRIVGLSGDADTDTIDVPDDVSVDYVV